MLLGEHNNSFSRTPLFIFSNPIPEEHLALFCKCIIYIKIWNTDSEFELMLFFEGLTVLMMDPCDDGVMIERTHAFLSMGFGYVFGATPVVESASLQLKLFLII